MLTNRNHDGFPQLFSFLLEKRKLVTDGSNPLYGDLFAHIIPVGGDSNIELRPTAEEFRRFYEQKWDEVCELWDAYQGDLGIPKDERRGLIGYFGNPFIRIDHRGGLDAYVRASEEGRYGKLALREYCYVAPTQASFTPDGTQYRCGSHAVRHTLPVGNIKDGVFANIREGIAGLKDLPQEEHCYGCALATLWINQSVESKLKETLDSVLSEKESGS